MSLLLLLPAASLPPGQVPYYHYPPMLGGVITANILGGDADYLGDYEQSVTVQGGIPIDVDNDGSVV